MLPRLRFFMKLVVSDRFSEDSTGRHRSNARLDSKSALS